MDTDEFKPPSAEVYDMVEKRLIHAPRCLGSGKHHALMQRLYAEYADSMGKLSGPRVEVILDEWDDKWQLDIGKIKNAEQSNTINHTLHTVTSVEDQESLQVQRNAQSVKR